MSAIYKGVPIRLGLTGRSCEKYPETMIHVFCECEVVIPLWNDMVEIINHKEVFLLQL